jgi:hypothetical protein
MLDPSTVSKRKYEKSARTSVINFGRLLRIRYRGPIGRLRELLRRNEFFLIPLALLAGSAVGAIVTAMSEIAQIAHVLIYGIPIDVRLSAHACHQSLGGACWRRRAAVFCSASWSGRGAAGRFQRG